MNDTAGDIDREKGVNLISIVSLRCHLDEDADETWREDRAEDINQQLVRLHEVSRQVLGSESWRMNRQSWLMELGGESIEHGADDIGRDQEELDQDPGLEFLLLASCSYLVFDENPVAAKIRHHNDLDEHENGAQYVNMVIHEHFDVFHDSERRVKYH